MKKLSVFIFVLSIVFAACSKDKDADITVKYTGTKYDGDIAVVLAIAEGAAYNQDQLNDLDVIETTSIEPSESEQTHVFSVPTEKNYTVFIFHDLNENGKYDHDETVRMASPITFLEEDESVSISYNY